MSAWRERRRAREEGVEVELPSGMFARIRPVSFTALLSYGNVPEMLTPIIREAAAGKLNADGVADADAVTRTFELANAVCRYAFVYPRIVNTPEEDDEISIEDVDLDDRMEVMNFLNKPLSHLRSFRSQQTAAVEFVPNGKSDEPTAESAVEVEGA
jgi:hypothetical protein